MVSKLSMTVDYIIMLMLVSMALILMQDHIVGGQRQIFSVELFRQLIKQATSITMVGHFLRDLDFVNVHMA